MDLLAEVSEQSRRRWRQPALMRHRVGVIPVQLARRVITMVVEALAGRVLGRVIWFQRILAVAGPLRRRVVAVAAPVFCLGRRVPRRLGQRIRERLLRRL
jgi:hypothetical protein